MGSRMWVRRPAVRECMLGIMCRSDDDNKSSPIQVIRYTRVLCLRLIVIIMIIRLDNWACAETMTLKLTSDSTNILFVCYVLLYYALECNIKRNGILRHGRASHFKPLESLPRPLFGHICLVSSFSTVVSAALHCISAYRSSDSGHSGNL
jgi:hypothetical protein